MKKYTGIFIEVIRYDDEDIITKSVGDYNLDWLTSKSSNDFDEIGGND